MQCMIKFDTVLLSFVIVIGIVIYYAMNDNTSLNSFIFSHFFSSILSFPLDLRSH